MKITKYFKKISEARGSVYIGELAVLSAAALLVAGGISLGAKDIIEKAKDAQKFVNMHQLSTALELYYLDNLSYPKAAAGAGENLSFMISELEQRNYIDSPPQSTQDYNYQPVNDGQGYILRVKLDRPENNIKKPLETSDRELNCAAPFYCIRM